MKLLGFNFTRISAFREPALTKVDKINTDVTLTEVEKDKVEMVDLEVAKVSFRYIVKYEPGKADIVLEGNLLLALSQEDFKELLKTWKKKQLPENMKLPIFNLIFTKCNLRALRLEEELNLPLHLKLPRVASKQD